MCEVHVISEYMYGVLKRLAKSLLVVCVSVAMLYQLFPNLQLVNSLHTLACIQGSRAASRDGVCVVNEVSTLFRVAVSLKKNRVCSSSAIQVPLC